jgi:hypothetical protein
MVQRKTVMGGGGLPGNVRLFRARSSKMQVYLVEIRQAEQQNKVVTVRFKQFAFTW